MLLRVAADAKDETDEDRVNALVDEEREFATMATVAMAAVLNFIVRRRYRQKNGRSAILFPPYPYLEYMYCVLSQIVSSLVWEAPCHIAPQTKYKQQPIHRV